MAGTPRGFLAFANIKDVTHQDLVCASSNSPRNHSSPVQLPPDSKDLSSVTLSILSGSSGFNSLGFDVESNFGRVPKGFNDFCDDSAISLMLPSLPIQSDDSDHDLATPKSSRSSRKMSRPTSYKSKSEIQRKSKTNSSERDTRVSSQPSIIVNNNTDVDQTSSNDDSCSWSIFKVYSLSSVERQLNILADQKEKIASATFEISAKIHELTEMLNLHQDVVDELARRSEATSCSIGINENLKKTFEQRQSTPCSFSVYEEPSYFIQPPFPSTLLFDEVGSIRGGTVSELIQLIIKPGFSNSQLTAVLLKCYSLFVLPEEFVETLLHYWNPSQFELQSIHSISVLDIPETDCSTRRSLLFPLKSISPLVDTSFYEQSSIAILTTTEQASMIKSIRFRLLAFLRKWMNEYWFDFEHSAMLLWRIGTWIVSQLADETTKLYHHHLSNLMAVLLNSHVAHADSTFLESTPPSLLPKEFLSSGNFEAVDLFMVDPIEIARQLCLLEQSLFQKIQIFEYLELNWSGLHKKVSCPNLAALIAHNNLLSSWIKNSIICNPNCSHRKVRLEFWLRVALELHSQRNLNGLMEILSAVGISAVSHLKRTWGRLDTKHLSSYQSLRELLSLRKNYSEHRNVLKLHIGPAVPYIGGLLNDLTSIADALPQYLDLDGKVINVVRYSRMSRLIDDIVRFKAPLYCFREVEPIQHFFKVGICGVKLYPDDILSIISKILE